MTEPRKYDAPPALKPTRVQTLMETAARLLTPAEVAALFRVDPKTVTRWAAAGRLSSIRTAGGHRRFREDEVKNALENGFAPPAGTTHNPSRPIAVPVREDLPPSIENGRLDGNRGFYNGGMSA